MAQTASTEHRKSAAISIIAAVFLLSLSDSFVKMFNGHFGLSQLVLVRSIIAIVLMLVGSIIFANLDALKTTAHKWVWCRSLFLALMWLLYYSALPSMSFAVAAAAFYSSPLWMALLSRVLLRQHVGLLKWIAICVGFIGVLLIVNPTSGAIDWISMLPLLAGLCYALAAIITWARCPNEKPIALSCNLNIALAVLSIIAMSAIIAFDLHHIDAFVFGIWKPLDVLTFSILIMLAFALITIATLTANAYQKASSPFVGIFDNAYLIFSILWGYLLFHEPLRLQEILGIGLIAISGIFASVSCKS